MEDWIHWIRNGSIIKCIGKFALRTTPIKSSYGLLRWSNQINYWGWKSWSCISCIITIGGYPKVYQERRHISVCSSIYCAFVMKRKWKFSYCVPNCKFSCWGNKCNESRNRAAIALNKSVCYTAIRITYWKLRKYIGEISVDRIINISHWC